MTWQSIYPTSLFHFPEYLKPPSTVTNVNESSLPGILPYKGYPSPVKITNVQLQGGAQSSDKHGWSTNIQYSNDEGLYMNDSYRGMYVPVCNSV